MKRRDFLAGTAATLAASQIAAAQDARVLQFTPQMAASNQVSAPGDKTIEQA